MTGRGRMTDKRVIVAALALGLPAVTSLLIASRESSSPDKRSHHKSDGEAKDRWIDYPKVRLEFVLLDMETERPVSEARLLLTHEYRLDKIPPEDLAPPTGLDGHTTLDLEVPSSSHRRDYAYGIQATADGYEPFQGDLRGYTGDQQYHMRDRPPPVVIRLRRQLGASGLRSRETIGSIRAASQIVTGTWTWGYKNPKYQEVLWKLSLQQDGVKLSGTLTYSVGGHVPDSGVDIIKDGEVVGKTVKFITENEVWNGTYRTAYTGKIEGGTIRGRRVTLHDERDEWISGWEAKRLSDEPRRRETRGKPDP